MNKSTAILATIFFLALSGSPLASEQSFVADTQNFGVRLFLVSDADAFVEMWSKPETPKLTLFNKAKVNSTFSGAILYWGGGTDVNGECNIQLQTQVLERGSVLARGPKVPVCQGHPPPPPGVLSLSDTMIDLSTPGEPAHLIVQVTITDKINNETLSVQAPLEVVAE